MINMHVFIFIYILINGLKKWKSKLVLVKVTTIFGIGIGQIIGIATSPVYTIVSAFVFGIFKVIITSVL